MHKIIVALSLSALVLTVSAVASTVAVDCHQDPNHSEIHIQGTLSLNHGNTTGTVHIVRAEKPYDMTSPLVGVYHPATKHFPAYAKLAMSFPDSQVQTLNAYDGDTDAKHLSSGRMKGDGIERPLVCRLTLVASASDDIQTVLSALESGSLTSKPLIAVKSIEKTGLLKCVPGITTFVVKGGVAVNGTYQEALLHIELGGCGSDDLSHQVKLVSEQYY